MVIRVSVIGYDLLGKRIADAVAQQHDMDLVGVFDDDPYRQMMIARRGYSLLQGSPRSTQSARRCGRSVPFRLLCCRHPGDLRGSSPVITGPTVLSAVARGNGVWTG